MPNVWFDGRLMPMALLIIMTLAVFTTSVSGEGRLYPHPWLTEDRSARVLKLECQLPKIAASEWSDVHDIRMFVCLGPPHAVKCANNTVVSITSTMPERPRLGSVLQQSPHKVIFTGELKPTGSISFTVMKPFSRDDYGVYYCTIEYGRSAGIHTYSTEITVNETSDKSILPVISDNFKAEIIKAHRLTVTWQPPDDTQFVEGRVTRMSADRDGKVTAAPRSLYMTTEARHFVYDHVGVLMTQLQHPSAEAGNFSMTVFVESSRCEPFCRYSCSVPYPACIGQEAFFCECSKLALPSSPTSSTSSTTITSPTTIMSPTSFTPADSRASLSRGTVAVICVVVLCVLCAVVGVLLCLLRCNKLPRLKGWINAARGQEGHTQDEEQTEKQQTKYLKEGTQVSDNSKPDEIAALLEKRGVDGPNVNIPSAVPGITLRPPDQQPSQEVAIDEVTVEIHQSNPQESSAPQPPPQSGPSAAVPGASPAPSAGEQSQQTSPGNTPNQNDS